MANHRRYMKLPLWMKMFSGGYRSSKDLDGVLQRIAKALKEGKEVITLQDGKPISITLVNGKVKIENINYYKFVIE